MKKFYFISGLPRSGNTLLSSILNENPDILSTGQSIVPSVFYDLMEITQNNNVNKLYSQDERFEIFYKGLLNNFYKEDKQKYIIQRGEWITPTNLEIIQKYCPNEIKIIIMVRDVLDIIKSHLNHANSYPKYFLNNDNRDTQRQKVNHLMEEDRYMNLMLSSIKKLKDENSLNNYLLIEYDDLVNNTEDTLKSIYKYLDIKYYKHNLKNIKQLEGYNDSLFNHNLHEIYTKEIKKQSYQIDLEADIINKYKGLELWK